MRCVCFCLDRRVLNGGVLAAQAAVPLCCGSVVARSAVIEALTDGGGRDEQERRRERCATAAARVPSESFARTGSRSSPQLTRHTASARPRTPRKLATLRLTSAQTLFHSASASSSLQHRAAQKSRDGGARIARCDAPTTHATCSPQFPSHIQVGCGVGRRKGAGIEEQDAIPAQLGAAPAAAWCGVCCVCCTIAAHVSVCCACASADHSDPSTRLLLARPIPQSAASSRESQLVCAVAVFCCCSSALLPSSPYNSTTPSSLHSRSEQPQGTAPLRPLCTLCRTAAAAQLHAAMRWTVCAASHASHQRQALVTS